MYKEYTPEQIAHIKKELTPIDREAAYREELDGAYGTIDVCGYEFDAAALLEKVDPVAFRFGVKDYFGTSDYEEVNGETYDAKDVERVLAELEESNNS